MIKFLEFLNPIAQFLKDILFDDFHIKFPESSIPKIRYIKCDKIITDDDFISFKIGSPRSIADNTYDNEWKSEIKNKFVSW